MQTRIAQIQTAIMLNPLAARVCAVGFTLAFLLMVSGTSLYGGLAFMLLTAGSAHAQTTPGGTLETKLSEVTDTLTTLGRPVAIIALVLVFLTWIAEPVLPDVARENKGRIQKVALGAIMLGLAPDIADFLFV